MPTEHEYKMLLDRSPRTIRQVRKHADSTALIEQGYLVSDKGVSLRVRHSKKEKMSVWTLTTKVDVPDRVVELEQVIEHERDAADLWARCHSKLKKVRHFIKEKGHVWEIDVFFTEHVENIEEECYCVLAEIELPEKSPRPSDIPNFINDHLLYAVPLRDGRFSNKKLWDVVHTNELYRILGRDSHDVQGTQDHPINASSQILVSEE